MKILIINFEYPPLGGGGGVATRDFAESLATRHTVHVVTTWFKGLATEEVVEGVHIHRVKCGRKSLPTATLLSMVSFVFPAALTALFLTAKVRFNVINAQFVIPSGVPAALVSFLYRIPLVISFIGGDIYDPSKGASPHRYLLLRFLIRFLSHQAVAGTAISEDTKQRAQNLHGVTLPITVTPLGINLTTFPAATRGELELPESGTIFISIGRLIPRKGFEQLLEIWNHVEDAHLVIVGEGPLRSELENMRDRLDLRERVHLVGFVDEKRKTQLLQVASAYISAATHEGFGIVFLEAMAAGLPIIATNNGGQTDFLTPLKNALLVPSGNDQALLAAIRQLQSDERLRATQSANNKQKVQEYTIPKTTLRLEEVLTKAASIG